MFDVIHWKWDDYAGFLLCLALVFGLPYGFWLTLRWESVRKRAVCEVAERLDLTCSDNGQCLLAEGSVDGFEVHISHQWEEKQGHPLPSLQVRVDLPELPYDFELIRGRGQLPQALSGNGLQPLIDEFLARGQGSAVVSSRAVSAYVFDAHFKGAAAVGGQLEKCLEVARGLRAAAAE